MKGVRRAWAALALSGTVAVGLMACSSVPVASTSAGEAGGITVLWPRIVPFEQTDAVRAQAEALRARLIRHLRELHPDVALDIRPEPERVCPPGGCAGPAVGVLLATKGGGCTVVVQKSPPGESPAEQILWAGVAGGAIDVPFGEAPESHLTVMDFVPCQDLVTVTEEREGHVRVALQTLF